MTPRRARQPSRYWAACRAQSRSRSRSLRKRFGSVEALSGVSFGAETGTVLGLLGPNGAGKTTAVRILTTLLRPGRRARLGSRGSTSCASPARVREQIGLAGQYAAVDEYLTGFENLEMVGRLYHHPSPRRRGSAPTRSSRSSGSAEAGARCVRTYSGGMRRRLDLAAALVARPPILFLDEPTTGLDIRSRLALWESIEALVAARHDGASDHAVPGGGRPPRRPDRGDQPRVGDRRGHLRASSRSRSEATGWRSASRGGADPAAAGESSRGLGEAAPAVLDGTVSVPVTGEGGTVTAAVRRLDEAGIAIDDIATARPTLDDVFLELTGRTATEEEEERG